jgi:twitching motility protein PilT
MSTAADTPLSIDELLRKVKELEASDLHLTPGSEPVVRVRGQLEPLDGYGKLTPDTVRDVMYRILSTEQQKLLETKRSVDLAYSLPGVARFRVNVFFQRASIGAALRLIPAEIKSLDELGLPTHIGEFASIPRGLVLVTGPTGSGKSTTLATLIDMINRSRREHILTIEDPIEFLHWHRSCIVNQREIGSDATSFADGLRAALRQDPDIILVGEIRDRETAEIAVQSALTGHMVLSSLHATDVAGALLRFTDMGIEGFLIASSVISIVAQRLVRKICDGCKTSHTPVPAEVEFATSVGAAVPRKMYHGAGCGRCNHTGYYDRVGVFEVLTMNDELRRMVIARAGHREIMDAAVMGGVVPLRRDAWSKAAAGVTTVSEILRSVYIL